MQVFDVGTGVMMAAAGRDQAGRRGDDRGRLRLRPEPVPARHRRLLFDARRHDAHLPLQLLLADPLLQQGHLREGRPRRDRTRPKTWDEVWAAAKQIKESGAAPCGYTSAWLTWIHLENFAAWNNVPYGTNENGLAGPDVELQINAPIFVDHFQAIADLAKDGTFKYGGRTSEAKQIFTAGECGIYTDSLGRHRRHHQVGDELRHRPAALRQRRAEARRRTPSPAAPASGSSATSRPRPTRASPPSSTTCRRPRCRSTCTRPRATCR